mgnify:FL=1
MAGRGKHAYTSALSKIPQIDAKDPQWDSDPLTRGLWFNALSDTLYVENTSFRTLIEKGYIVIKGKVQVKSQEHLVIVRDNLDPTVYSFTNPSPVDPVAAYLALVGAAVGQPILNAAVAAGFADPNSERFKIAPEEIEVFDQALADAIAVRIKTKSDLSLIHI